MIARCLSFAECLICTCHIQFLSNQHQLESIQWNIREWLLRPLLSHNLRSFRTILVFLIASTHPSQFYAHCNISHRGRILQMADDDVLAPQQQPAMTTATGSIAIITQRAHANTLIWVIFVVRCLRRLNESPVAVHSVGPVSTKRINRIFSIICRFADARIECDIWYDISRQAAFPAHRTHHYFVPNVMCVTRKTITIRWLYVEMRIQSANTDQG